MYTGDLLCAEEIFVNEIFDKIADTVMLSINLSHDK